jgi:hypothetical protein
VLETALEVEMDDHLGYVKHAPEGRDKGNSRNGSRSKTVLTDVGEVEIEVPRGLRSSDAGRRGAIESQVAPGLERYMLDIASISSIVPPTKPSDFDMAASPARS